MQVIINGGWATFTVFTSFTLLLLMLLFRIQHGFMTKDPILKKFDIMDLQNATSEEELNRILIGIHGTPNPKKVFRALNAHLVLDFIFIPFVYGLVFIGAMLLLPRQATLGTWFFMFVGWFQALAVLADLVENIFLLKKINQVKNTGTAGTSPFVFSLFKSTRSFKWITVFCGLSVFLCLLLFWLSGRYSVNSLKYLWIIFGELILFGLIIVLWRRTHHPDLLPQNSAS